MSLIRLFFHRVLTPPCTLSAPGAQRLMHAGIEVKTLVQIHCAGLLIPVLQGLGALAICNKFSWAN